MATGRKSDKLWRDAILLAVNEVDASGQKKLRTLATKVVDMALAGDIQAAKEIADRIDGKPKQEIDSTVDVGVNYLEALRLLNEQRMAQNMGERPDAAPVHH